MTKIYFTLLALLLSINIWSIEFIGTEKKEKVIEYPDYKLVWAEEFNYIGLPDSTFWDYHEGYERNSEIQDFKKANLKYSRVENGRLILEAHKDPHNGINKWTKKPYHFDFSSAEVITDKKISFKYGRIDVAAKIPLGRGVWPAIWMMPVKSVYGGWPRSGEIDIMEYVWGIDENHETIASTVHTEDIDINKNKIESGWASSNTLSTSFHLYSLIWKENSIEILFDNKTIFTYSNISPSKVTASSAAKWPFNQEFYLMMNISIGGSWGGIWGIDESIFPARMEIDYVRYYIADFS